MTGAMGRTVVTLGACLGLLAVLVAPRAPASAPDASGAAGIRAMLSLAPLDRVVADDGSDDADGTLERPWRTLQHALDQAEPGTTVWVRAGRHAGFRSDRSGTAAAPITIAAWPQDAAPVIDGAIDGRADVIAIEGVRHMAIRGLHVTGAQGGVFSGAGIRVERSSRVEIAGNLVTRNQGSGVLARDATHVLIAGNELSHNASGVRVSGAGEGIVIRDNQVHHTDRMLRDTPTPTDDDAGGDAIALDGSTGAVLITGNRVWANRARSHDYTWDGGAFALHGASNVTITGNLVWDNENVLETGTDGAPCARNVFLRNVAIGRPEEGRSFGLFLRCGEGMLVAHNTLRDLAFGFSIGPDSSSYSGSVAGLRIVNNIVDLHASGGTLFGLFAPLPEDLVVDHDLVRTSGLVADWWEGEAVELSDFQERTGLEMHGLWADPRFRGADDHAVAADSAAVDAALRLPGINDGFAGAGPDIGALEADGPGEGG